MMTPISYTSLWSRSWRSFYLSQRHFAGVPMILYTPKVSSERVVDAIGSTHRWRRNDAKVTCPCRSTPTMMGEMRDFSRKHETLSFDEQLVVSPKAIRLVAQIVRCIKNLAVFFVVSWIMINFAVINKSETLKTRLIRNRQYNKIRRAKRSKGPNYYIIIISLTRRFCSRKTFW